MRVLACHTGGHCKVLPSFNDLMNFFFRSMNSLGHIGELLALGNAQWTTRTKTVQDVEFWFCIRCMKIRSRIKKIIRLSSISLVKVVKRWLCVYHTWKLCHNQKQSRNSVFLPNMDVRLHCPELEQKMHFHSRQMHQEHCVQGGSAENCSGIWY
jgi:hypothetical protein